MTTRDILADLVAFDTTSRDSNLPLVDYVRRYLAGHGVEAEIFLDAEGRKANLYATIGRPGEGGFILSGHTDCVPVDGQDWTIGSLRSHRTRRATLRPGCGRYEGLSRFGSRHRPTPRRRAVAPSRCTSHSPTTRKPAARAFAI